jgi:WhiB family redox-sensing transcriptional regulator
MRCETFGPSVQQSGADVTEIVEDTRSWAADGACHPRFGHDPKWWFPESDWSHRHPYVRAAKKVCVSCPVVDQCLDYSLVHEPFGIWGGMTERQREVMRRETGLPRLRRDRRRGREV